MRHALRIALLPIGCLWMFLLGCSVSHQNYDRELSRLKTQAQQAFKKDVDVFNGYGERPASDGPYDQKNAYSFLKDRVPLFLSPDGDFNQVFNYRWWMMSKHLRPWTDPQTQTDYWVITEFFGWPAHGSISGAISCAAGHQFYDMRWFRDTAYLKSYIDFYMKGYAAKNNQREGRPFHSFIPRPESHHFTSWMIDGTEAFLKVHPNAAWRDSLLPYLEAHQKIWDDKFTIAAPGSKTHGLYKTLDVYDGMEFTLSATTALIASDGPYTIYTEEDWRKYYRGWGGINRLRDSQWVKDHPQAFGRAYPQLYLARPSVNSYQFANLRSLGKLYALKATETKDPSDTEKSTTYLNRAEAQRERTLKTLWHSKDNFFHSYTAADNSAGLKDYTGRVRESAGYTPWYFNLPHEQERSYDGAWDMLASKKGFYNEKGMTTAEIQHPLYDEGAYAWNGRGWPFQNSVVNKAYANYLKSYKPQVTDGDRYLLFDLIEKLVSLHGEERNIGEWYLPSEGETFGGVKDYFHSTLPDMIIEDLIGFTAYHEDRFSVHALLPRSVWDYFYLGNIRYHGRDIDIVWKKDWDPKTSGNQSQLCVWVDGALVAQQEDLNGILQVTLP